MDVEFSDRDLDQMETDPDFNGGFSQAIAGAYRKRMQTIRAAVDERDLYPTVRSCFGRYRANVMVVV